MVRISAGIPLLTVIDGTNILGVVEKSKDDTFLLTSDRSITVFKPQDPKPLQSWVNKPSSRFTCAAIYVTDSEEFVAVVNDKQIYKWSSQNATPFKQKPKTLKSGVSQILIVDRGSPLLLMSNGSVMSLNDALAGRSDMCKGCLGEDEKIRDAWVWKQGGDDENATSYIVCLVENLWMKKKDILLLPVHPGEKHHGESGDDVIRLRLADPTNGKRPLESAAFFCNETMAVLHSLWEGGHLCSSSITESDLRRHKDVPHVPCHHRCTLHENTGKVRIAAIDDRHVAVAGMQRKTTKDKLEASLCIWETGYGTLQSYLPLRVEEEDDDGTPSFLGEVSGHLLLATQRTVMLHRYECSDGTLAAALGRLADEDQGQDLPILGLDWTSSVVQETPAKKSRGRKSAAVTKTQTKSKQSDGQTSSLLNSILDASSNQTSKAFSSSVEKFLKGCGDKQPDSTALVLVLRNVIKRSEANTKFWCPEALHDIIATKALAASSCPEFVAMLARKQEVLLLLDCLQCMRDIPELTLVQCLQVFLSIDEDKLPSSRHTTESDMEDATEHEVISPARRTYVDEVLCKPFTDSFLLDAVKYLQFQEVTSLLRYLHFLLTTSFPAVDDSSLSAVSMDSVVDWIGTLLDAHFAQLVLIPEVRPLLTQLKNAVKNQVQFSAELNVVRNLLHHTQSARSRIKSTRSNAAKSYAIEVLKM